MNRVTALLILALMGLAALVLAGRGYLQKAVPDEPPGITWKSEEASRLNESGLVSLEGRRLDEAVARFRAARTLEPTSTPIAHNLSLGLSRMARVRSEAGDAGNAEGLLAEALDIWPENPEALSTRTTIYYQAGRYEEAREAALRLNDLYPGNGDVEKLITHLEAYLEETEGMVSEEGDQFRLLYSSERQLEFEGELISMLQDEMDSLTALMGYFPTDVIDVLLMTEDLGERAKPLDPLLTGLYDGKIRVYLDGAAGEEEGLRKIVRHEMVHALLHRAGGLLPGWFQEGMAQFLGDRVTTDEGPAMRDYLRMRLDDGYVLNLTALGDSFIEIQGEDRATAYTASYLFVEYLVRIFGENLIPVILGELESGVKLEPALLELTGKDVLILQSDFLEDVRRGV